MGSKALIVPSPKLPIRISSLNWPKPALACVTPQGEFSVPLEANRFTKLPSRPKMFDDSIAGCIDGVVLGVILHCVSHEYPTSYLLNVERRIARR